MLSWTSYTNNDLHWSGVSSVSFDNQGGIWFGHLYGGLTYYDGINFNKIGRWLKNSHFSPLGPLPYFGGSRIIASYLF